MQQPVSSVACLPSSTRADDSATPLDSHSAAPMPEATDEVWAAYHEIFKEIHTRRIILLDKDPSEILLCCYMVFIIFIAFIDSVRYNLSVLLRP